MKILILYLTSQRDRDIDGLLGRHLKGLGHEVHVHPYMDAGRQSVPYMKPDVVVHPFPGGQYKVDFIRKCKEWGCLVVIRRGEAGVSLRTFMSLEPEEKKLILGNWPYDDYVDLELVWGAEFRNILVQYGHVAKKKMQVCGAFAFDFYFLPSVRRTRNRQKTVLFATGFSTADSHPDYCEIGLQKDSPYQQQTYEKHRAGRDTWIEAIRKLYEQFKTVWKFTLKIRPGERTNEYQEKLGDIVEIYPETYSAAQALCNTDLLIHSGSTMAMEAHLLKMPSVNFCNMNPDPMLANLAPRVENWQELIPFFQDADLDNTNVNWSVFYDLRNHLYGEIDGQACRRAAVAIHNLTVVNKGKLQKNIPDTWPMESLYLVEGVILDKPDFSEHKPRWFCPACKGIWWTNDDIFIIDCPWCGMRIERRRMKSANPPALVQSDRSVL